eukprot:786110-Prorocentrum_minimum.AAC.5
MAVTVASACASESITIWTQSVEFRCEPQNIWHAFSSSKGLIRAKLACVPRSADTAAVTQTIGGRTEFSSGRVA